MSVISSSVISCVVGMFIVYVPSSFVCVSIVFMSSSFRYTSMVMVASVIGVGFSSSVVSKSVPVIMMSSA